MAIIASLKTSKAEPTNLVGAYDKGYDRSRCAREKRLEVIRYRSGRTRDDRCKWVAGIRRTRPIVSAVKQKAVSPERYMRWIVNNIKAEGKFVRARKIVYANPITPN